MSSPERAYLEVLVDVPKTVSFEHADQLLQGVTTLSPRRMEHLLRNCANVKVRRLFILDGRASSLFLVEETARARSA